MVQRLYAGMSAEERSTRRFEQFLEGGLEVFSERGWAASTVQDVCRAAGLSPRYFYELFGSREDLFRAICERIGEDIRRTVRAAVDAEDRGPQARARAVLGALAQYFTADPRTARVALMESLATEEFRQQRHDLLGSFSALTARLMRPLSAGEPDERRLRLSAAALTGGLVELVIAGAGVPGPVADLDPLLDHLTALYTAAARL
ncbi:TetR/AcrR family transcriptional regulator [Blastococcus sp. TF02A_35]|uniref:TetR/AcrR family transcriptional regulator n=1 Tax=Blastococcus sp. TF02A-35 TaxID=2559612 RepID=UPI0010740FF4|nr:TetR/AcrR family transcriptional regulator [Blastococcus sp. TF02A_35]TFV52641.1 TetR/AcrR family transcriptional regulator [Blastococcus sp. TF02A_35]